ncbi:AI-2E family transporter [Nocardioides sambongensis]|uniref:AI-2E family transporter n=1 Tax=Nocardioides sambongensis TaxID=2589074 RepID=UPI00112B9B72|nr:AI-2E family transporter [Nocardioides sambongensis]
MSSPGPAQPRGAARVPGWVERLGRQSWAFIGIVVAAGIIVGALVALQDLVVPLLIAVVAAVIFAPLVDWLERHRVARGPGSLIVTALVVSIGVAAVALVVRGVVDRADELQQTVNSALGQLQVDLPDSATDGWLEDLDLDVGGIGAAALSGMAGGVGDLVGSAAGTISAYLLSLVLLYYLLKDGRALLQRGFGRRSGGSSEQVSRMLAQAAYALRANARGRSLLATVQGVFAFLATALLGVPFPATIGIVNFVGAFIPYLGALLGGAFAVVMALSEGGLPLAGWTLLAIVFMNVVLENLLEPRLIGSSMQMHPVIVLVTTVAGGLVAGLLGLILAAPAVAIGTNLVRELKASGFFGPQARAAAPEPDPAPDL